MSGSASTLLRFENLQRSSDEMSHCGCVSSRRRFIEWHTCTALSTDSPSSSCDLSLEVTTKERDKRSPLECKMLSRGGRVSDILESVR